jgi:hypothetical protein
MQVANGTADVITYFVLRDSTNHAPKTDVTITDIDLYYCEQGAAMAAKVDATALAAADSAHADNKAFHVGQGLYRIDWPDEAFNGGVGKVANLIVVCTGVDTTFLEVELVGVAQTGDAYARLGAPAGASVSADIANVPTVSEFEARTLPSADYTVVGDLPSVPSAADNATAAAAAVLATPANKLATDASGYISGITGTKNTLDSLSGADGDTLKDLSDEIAAIAVGAGLTAQEVRDAMKLAPTAGAPAAGSVDAHLDDILEDTGTTLDGLIDAIKAKTDALDVTGTPAVVSLVDGGDLTVIAGATFDPAAITGLTIAATWTSAYFTVKTKKEGSGLLLAADSSAVIQIRVSNPGTAGDGLLYLNGAAASSAAYGSLALDAGAGTATIVLADDATVLLAKKAGLFWDVKVLAADGTSDVVCSGSLDVVLTPTKTV